MPIAPALWAQGKSVTSENPLSDPSPTLRQDDIAAMLFPARDGVGLSGLAETIRKSRLRSSRQTYNGELLHSHPSIPTLLVTDKGQPSASPARWIRAGYSVQLEIEPDARLTPAAGDIYSAAFGGAGTVLGHRVDNPIVQLAELRFSKVPATPAIRLSGTTLGALKAQTGVWGRGAFTELQRQSDQAIIGDTWYPVRSEELDQVFEWLRRNEIDPNKPLTLAGLIRLRQAPPDDFRLIDDAGTDFSESASANLDLTGLHATLYPYQHVGAAFLGMISQQGVGCLLADEMGLGKTLQVIALLNSERSSSRGPSLVVAPATLLENWRREMLTFAPLLRVLVHSGVGRAGVPGILEAFDVVVTSYDITVRDEELLGRVAWNVVALDEAQNIKNPAAYRTASVKKLRRRVSIAVTGTPVENRLDDLWSISDFCLPGLLGELTDFRQGYGDTQQDAQALGAVVAPVILRRRVADVAQDLPELVEIPQPIAMSDRMAAAYENLRTAAVAAGTPSLALLMPLRKLTAHPALIQQWDADMASDVPKHERLVEILEEAFAASQKVLVFAGFQQLLDLLRADLGARWPQGFFEVIDGRTPVAVRQEAVDSFSAYENYGALLLNPRAAGTGLNITAANHVIHYTPEWNPAATAQASARAYRRKQKLPVTVHHLFYVDSVEEVMMQRAVAKRQLAAEAVTGNEGDASASDILSALRCSPAKSSQTRHP